MQQEIIDDKEKILSQWLMFMLERVGHNNLPLLLDHYEDLGWINTDVSYKLIELAQSQKQRYEGPSWTLSAEDHRTSMRFIEKLQGKPVEISIISSIARARTEVQQVETPSPRESYIEAHKLEKNELEFEVTRREVTIKNLEAELEKKDMQINDLREIIQGLEYQLNENREEVKKSRIFRRMLEENISLKKNTSLHKIIL